jgi:hypothetical protein
VRTVGRVHRGIQKINRELTLRFPNTGPNSKP